ncbi:hypothetical protein, partial [Campylobacter sp. BCW_6873]|uniref:hypothetical protein n=1 Tax=Campylobacter sp. BCW_6873 TaxID=1903286 RepID=UPI001C993DD7
KNIFSSKVKFLILNLSFIKIRFRAATLAENYNKGLTMKRHSKRFVRLYLNFRFFKFKMEVFLAKPQDRKAPCLC